MAAGFVGLLATAVAASMLGMPPTGGVVPVSVDSFGADFGEAAVGPSIDPSGRFVVFEVRGEVPGIFLKDLATGSLVRVTPVVSAGPHAFFKPAVARNGTAVAFRTNATLLPEDTHAGFDIYVMDMRTGVLTLATVSPTGAAPDRGSVHATAMDDSGTIVAFHANAGNLVENDTNHGFDVFVRDIKRGTTVRASVSSDGTEANGSSTEPALSGNGRYVVFQSEATNLAGATSGLAEAGEFEQVYLHDLLKGTTELVSAAETGGPASNVNATISANGRWVVYQSVPASSPVGVLAGDSDHEDSDHEGGCGGGEHGGGGGEGSGGGGGGCHEAAPAGHLYLVDRMRGLTTRLDLGIDVPAAVYPRISGDGSTVVFRSDFALVAEDTNGVADVYRYDIRTGVIDLVSWAGGPADGPSAEGSRSIAAAFDGRRVVFDTNASNLVPGDLDGEPDVVARDFLPGKGRGRG